ncbi:MAG TPA: RES family NAD+ phosphorylase [Luteimonas sp.]|nr:RES family NAD+ phosphorylase [Luteimonas sp.]HRO26033.1 RES family NAD+ phosphorylase [Luteimonas sp.]HRP73108.1 RES family NAD+ phosphorylase [Luteimonas sp.]
MAKLPAPPSVAHLRTLPRPVKTLQAGDVLARVGFAGGDHPTTWNGFRYWGPTGARFDHHLRDTHGRPQHQDRGVLYAAKSAQTCLAEVFQHARVVDVHARQPWLAVWTLVHRLTLLDLTGEFVTRMGASTAIHSGSRACARLWAAALYEAWPDLDGIAYCSSMNGNAGAYALNERALRTDPFPATPDSHRMLADPLTADRIDAAAANLGYMVKR